MAMLRVWASRSASVLRSPLSPMNRNRGSNRNDQSNQNDSKEAVYNNQLILSFPFLFFLIHPIIKQTISSIFNDFISIGCYFCVFVFFFFWGG